MRERIRAHYEHVITVCCFLFLFVNIGFPSTSISVYQPYIAALPGIGDIGASIILTTRSTVSLLTLLVVDRVITRLGIRVTAALSCAITCGGFMCYALAGGLASFPVFVLGAVLIGASYGCGGMVCMTMLLHRWFSDDVGRSIGIATVGSGAAGVLVPLCATAVIGASSLSAAFFVEGAAALAISALVFALVRNSPAELGLTSHTLSEAAKGKPHFAHECSPNPVPASIRLGLYAAVGLLGAAAIGGTTFLSILMTSEGIDVVFAGTMVSVTSFFLVVGKVVVGKAFDRWGGVRASATFFTLLALGIACFCIASPRLMPLIAAGAAMFGTGVAIATVGTSVWSLELSDAAHQLKDVKGLQAAYAAGGVLFNLIPGILMEAFGSYAISYVLMLLCTIASAALVLRAYRWKSGATRPAR